MFFDPWTQQIKVSLAAGVQEPDRLELEDAFIRFESAGDRVRWESGSFGRTPYVNARKDFHMVFPLESVHLANIRSVNGTLYVKYAQEMSGRSRSRYVAIRCVAAKEVALDARHQAPTWQLRRAGLVSWLTHGFAGLTG